MAGTQAQWTDPSCVQVSATPVHRPGQLSHELGLEGDGARSHPWAEEGGGSWETQSRVRQDIPQGSVNKAERMCLLGALFLTEEQDPGQSL